MKQLGLGLATIAAILAVPTAANAARLAFSGNVQLDTAARHPVEAVRVTVTFHGHEEGIHDYETARTARAVTAADGSFSVEVKLSEYRYRWTHVTVEVNSTDISKEMIDTATCISDGEGGCSGVKDFQVEPLLSALAALEEGAAAQRKWLTL